MVDNSERMVAVPIELLRQVLETAEDNSLRVEGEFASSDAEHAAHRLERSLIDELRQVAGIQP